MDDTKGNLIRLASLVEESIVDGPGLRFVLFTQGCPHRCLGCHNPETHLPIGGTLVSPGQVVALYQEHIDCRGVTFSGGEPFSQANSLYYIERLQTLGSEDSGISHLLKETDLLIDGPFVLEKRSLESPFVGSTNQRLVALSPAGNRLLEDVPILPEGPTTLRIQYKVS
jgi:anaerobic ribonucleoside-triphosphate reductase activating protein